MNASSARKPATIATLALGLVFFQGVEAADLVKYTANPTAWCQGALPAFEGALRKRPLALQNEGTAPAFVSCSIPTADNSRFIDLTVQTAGQRGEESNVSCTLVSGFNTGTNQFVTKTSFINDDNSQTILFWTATEVLGDGFPSFEDSRVNLSCQLPPGVGLNQIILTALEGTR